MTSLMSIAAGGFLPMPLAAEPGSSAAAAATMAARGAFVDLTLTRGRRGGSRRTVAMA